VSSNPAGFQDDDSDSDSDEQVILVPSYPSNNIPGAEPKDTSDAHSNGVLVDTTKDIFQQELARLKDQEQRATSDAERLGLGFAKDAEELQKRASAKTVPPGSIPVPTGSILVLSGDTMVSPSDVPVPSASTVEVSPVVTKRINTVHPQSLIIGEPNSSVQTRSQVHKKTTGETAFLSYIQDQQRNNHTDFQSTKSLHKRDIILVQVYVDDIIFGSTKKAWCDEFEALMKGEFEMSAMGDLMEFLSAKTNPKSKFDLECVRTATTPYEAPKPKSKNDPD
ncbi:hypothetical protein Tco_1159048, partial [Tanacetum coccineum]